MIIKINETQYKNLNEAVGVPTHIVDVARQVFNKIMSGLKPTTKLSSYLNKTIGIFDLYKKLIKRCRLAD